MVVRLPRAAAVTTGRLFAFGIVKKPQDKPLPILRFFESGHQDALTRDLDSRRVVRHAQGRVVVRKIEQLGQARVLHGGPAAREFLAIAGGGVGEQRVAEPLGNLRKPART